MKIQLRFLTNFVRRIASQISVRQYTRSNVVCNKIDANIENWKEELHNTMHIFPNFVSIEEESSLLAEVDRSLHEETSIRAIALG